MTTRPDESQWTAVAEVPGRRGITIIHLRALDFMTAEEVLRNNFPGIRLHYILLGHARIIAPHPDWTRGDKNGN